MGQADPRVPCGTLDDGPTGLKQPLVFGVLDEEEGGSVFDRPAGGHEFGLGEDVAAGLFGEAVETDLSRFGRRQGQQRVSRWDRRVASIVGLTKGVFLPELPGDSISHMFFKS